MTDLDDAYTERATLLSLLSCLYPAVLAPAQDVEEPGWSILYLDLSGGLNLSGSQASWHIAPLDRWLFRHVPRVSSDHERARWDGHTTAQKYRRIRDLVGSLN